MVRPGILSDAAIDELVRDLGDHPAAAVISAMRRELGLWAKNRAAVSAGLRELAKDADILRAEMGRRDCEIVGLRQGNDLLQAENELLRQALHDAIRRPMGVVPESAEPFYDHRLADLAEACRVIRPIGSHPN